MAPFLKRKPPGGSAEKYPPTECYRRHDQSESVRKILEPVSRRHNGEHELAGGRMNLHYDAEKETCPLHPECYHLDDGVSPFKPWKADQNTEQPSKRIRSEYEQVDGRSEHHFRENVPCQLQTDFDVQVGTHATEKPSPSLSVISNAFNHDMEASTTIVTTERVVSEQTTSTPTCTTSKTVTTNDNASSFCIPEDTKSLATPVKHDTFLQEDYSTSHTASSDRFRDSAYWSLPPTPENVKVHIESFHDVAPDRSKELLSQATGLEIMGHDVQSGSIDILVIEQKKNSGSEEQIYDGGITVVSSDEMIESANEALCESVKSSLQETSIEMSVDGVSYLPGLKYILPFEEDQSKEEKTAAKKTEQAEEPCATNPAHASTTQKLDHNELLKCSTWGDVPLSHQALKDISDRLRRCNSEWPQPDNAAQRAHAIKALWKHMMVLMHLEEEQLDYDGDLKTHWRTTMVVPVATDIKQQLSDAIFLLQFLLEPLRAAIEKKDDLMVSCCTDSCKKHGLGYLELLAKFLETNPRRQEFFQLIPLHQFNRMMLTLSFVQDGDLEPSNEVGVTTTYGLSEEFQNLTSVVDTHLKAWKVLMQYEKLDKPVEVAPSINKGNEDMVAGDNYGAWAMDKNWEEQWVAKAAKGIYMRIPSTILDSKKNIWSRPKLHEPEFDIDQVNPPPSVVDKLKSLFPEQVKAVTTGQREPPYKLKHHIARIARLCKNTQCNAMLEILTTVSQARSCSSTKLENEWWKYIGYLIAESAKSFFVNAENCKNWAMQRAALKDIAHFEKGFLKLKILTWKSARPCKMVNKHGGCRLGDECDFWHGLHHRVCEYFRDGQACFMGESDCPMSHLQTDLDVYNKQKDSAQIETNDQRAHGVRKEKTPVAMTELHKTEMSQALEPKTTRENCESPIQHIKVWLPEPRTDDPSQDSGSDVGSYTADWSRCHSLTHENASAYAQPTVFEVPTTQESDRLNVPSSRSRQPIPAQECKEGKQALTSVTHEKAVLRNPVTMSLLRSGGECANLEVSMKPDLSFDRVAISSSTNPRKRQREDRMKATHESFSTTERETKRLQHGDLRTTKSRPSDRPDLARYRPHCPHQQHPTARDNVNGFSIKGAADNPQHCGSSGQSVAVNLSRSARHNTDNSHKRSRDEYAADEDQGSVSVAQQNGREIKKLRGSNVKHHHGYTSLKKVEDVQNQKRDKNNKT